MKPTFPSILSANSTRLFARVALSAWLLTTVLAVATTISPAASDAVVGERARPGDNELHWAVADRVARGEGYYRALAEELRLRGYPTRSVFNWRTPLPVWLVGHLSYPWIGRATLSILGLAMLVLGTGMVLHEDWPRMGMALLTALLLTGPAWVCAMRGLFISMHELWAGTLVAISVAAWGLNWRGTAIAAGMLAPFFRELALPYPLLCAALAWRERRYRELALWVAGLLAWIAFFAVHWLEVTRAMPPGGRFHNHSWIQLGGLPFIIATMSANYYLLLLPKWVSAVYFVAAMFGLLGWHTSGGRRVAITASLFVLLFSVVGQDFNFYWGMIYAPLMCFGAARFPTSLRNLWIAAEWRGSHRPADKSMNDWQLEITASGTIAIERLEIADRFWSRFRGLQFCRPLPPGHGILLAPCNSIHTMWMRFAIDAAMLDRSGRVLAIHRAVRPWRLLFAPRDTHAVLEAFAGTLRLSVGDVVALRSHSSQSSPPASLAGFSVHA